MKFKASIFILLIVCVIHATAQKELPINYLNQKAPGHVATVFAPGLLSTEALEHSAPAFSPDGKTVVWSVMKMPSYQICLLQMNYINDHWSAPHPPAFSDTTANEVYPNFSASGDTLFFSSNRIVPNSSFSNQTIWFVKRTKDGWSKALPLDTTMYKKEIYASSMAANGSRYFVIGPQGTMDWNIFYTDHTGHINPMPSYINAKGYEDGPFIAPDESYLIFESDRPTGVESFIDLYISFRKKDSSWSEPVNMGPTINTQWAERFATVSPDGKYLFFGRNTGKGFDIYWMDAGIIDTLRKAAVKSGLLD
jgi:Tol biopolymer transport system component